MGINEWVKNKFFCSNHKRLNQLFSGNFRSSMDQFQLFSVSMSLKNAKKVTDYLKISYGTVIEYTATVIKTKELDKN